jgi:hypothetical protein
MSKPAQSSHPSATPPPAQNLQDPDLQKSTGRKLHSLAEESQGLELKHNREHRLPSPPARDQELQGNKERRSPSPPARD